MIAIIKFEYSDLEFPTTKFSSSEQKLQSHLIHKLNTIDVQVVTVTEKLSEAVEIAENWGND